MNTEFSNAVLARVSRKTIAIAGSICQATSDAVGIGMAYNRAGSPCASNTAHPKMSMLICTSTTCITNIGGSPGSSAPSRLSAESKIAGNRFAVSAKASRFQRPRVSISHVIATGTDRMLIAPLDCDDQSRRFSKRGYLNLNN